MRAWIEVTSYADTTRVLVSRDGHLTRFVPYSVPVDNSHS